MEKVVLDKEKCIRCGACCATAPANFVFGDEDIEVISNTEITDSTKQAVENCPMSAIEIVNEEATAEIIPIAEETVEEDIAA